MFVFRIFSLLPFMVCLVWTVIIAMDNRKGWVKRDRKPLLAFAFLCTVLYLGHAWHFNEGRETFNLIDGLYLTCNLAVYPQYYLYIRSLTRPEGIRPAHCLVLLPALLMLAGSLYCLITGSGISVLLFFSHVIFPLTVLFTGYFGLKYLLSYDTGIRNLYADTESKTLEPFIWLIALFIATSVISVIVSFIGRDWFMAHNLLSIPSIMFSILLFSLFYLGSRLDFSVEDVMRDIPLPDEKELAIPEPKDGNASVFKELEQVMSERELFRRPGLRITDVAEEIGTNRTYLSNAVNQLTKQSFSDYINSLRVRAAQEALLKDGTGKTLSAVAEESGFSSEATFYRQFRRFTGSTPGEWLKEDGDVRPVNGGSRAD